MKFSVLAERFWRKVARRGPDECWLWLGGMKTKFGYGSFTCRSPVFNGTAHQMAWMLAHDQLIPPGMNALHSCDNPPCCNPAHLFLGTTQDNVDDKVRKGRARGAHRGEGNHSAKLTTAQVLAIRARVSAGETQTAVARDYGVDPSNVSYIVAGKSRRWG